MLSAAGLVASKPLINKTGRAINKTGRAISKTGRAIVVVFPTTGRVVQQARGNLRRRAKGQETPKRANELQGTLNAHNPQKWISRKAAVRT